MGFARAVANDMEVSSAGDLLSDITPGTLPMLNLAWREFQDALVNGGVEVLTRQADMVNFPPNLTNDPTAQAWIGFTQSFDGADYWPTPLLPFDMIEPLRIWQRQTGMDTGFIQVNPSIDGIVSSFSGSYIHAWDWREEKVFLTGALVNIDIRLRYSAYFNDFTPNQDGSFPSLAQVPIMRCAPLLAYFVAATFAGGRGSEYYDKLMGKGMGMLQSFFNRTARKKQRVNHRRRPYGSGGGSISSGW
jgi:hypothetical protein